MGAHYVKRLWQLGHRWSRMLFGASYWHQSQHIGRLFIPSELRGYFNDLTAKVAWEGKVDEQGIPLSSGPDTKPLYFATTIFQKAFGHWDRWLEDPVKCENDRDIFLRYAEWGLDSQDEQGGWPVWAQLEFNSLSPYSAMSQGEGISVLIRAFSLTSDQRYLDAANRALELLIKPVDEGGSSRIVPDGRILEELPLKKHEAILNGWIFALFGLYDFAIAGNSDIAANALDETLSALLHRLSTYNAGYWSYYDAAGTIASPFYHQLHIEQFKALEMTFPKYAGDIGNMRSIFESQAASTWNRSRAIAVKTCQKLMDPPEVVLR